MIDAPTPRLALPLLQPGQAQKEMSHNEALALLDLATQASVVAAGEDAPPAEPEEGACWIVGDAPTGDWAGHAGAIAGWTAAGWRFITPGEGFRAWVIESGAYALFLGGTWEIGTLHGRVMIDGEQVVGGRADAIGDPAGGVTIDAEARASVAAILSALRHHGLIGSA